MKDDYDMLSDDRYPDWFRHGTRPRKIELGHRIVGVSVFIGLNCLALVGMDGLEILFPSAFHTRTNAAISLEEIRALRENSSTEKLRVTCSYVFKQERYNTCNATLFPMKGKDFVSRVETLIEKGRGTIPVYVDPLHPSKAIVVWNSFPTVFVQLGLMAFSFLPLFLALRKNKENAVSDSIFC